MRDGRQTVIIGAGPAGLTAAYALSGEGVPVTVLEADPEYVGGISRTVEHDGFRFDIGGHRFFSKSQEVEELWTEILPDDLLERPRSSQIYYNRKFFSYPLRAGEALWRLGIIESTRCMLSYMKARAFPLRDPRSFEDWVSNQFGRRLYEIFFKTYTEKVWGMPCSEISADWAAQRIRGLSLGSAIRTALLPRSMRRRGPIIKTLIDSFRYPRHGPGMMWEACAAKVRERGGEIRMGARATALHRDPASGNWTVEYETDAGPGRVSGAHVVSSAALRDVIHALRPAASQEALHAANELRYRDFLVVALIVRGAERFADNWIYIHDPDVMVGRIQNFKSWSPEMVPDPQFSCYGLEYFCFVGDGVWAADDDALVERACREMAALGLLDPSQVIAGHVVRQARAYPVYDRDYAGHVATLRAELDAHYAGLHPIGRNGMHKYNNQDHAMMTALLTARNIVAGRQVYDVWRVNQDAEYHEAGSGDEGGRAIPTRNVGTPPRGGVPADAEEE